MLKFKSGGLGRGSGRFLVGQECEEIAAMLKSSRINMLAGRSSAPDSPSCAGQHNPADQDNDYCSTLPHLNTPERGCLFAWLGGVLALQRGEANPKSRKDTHELN